MLCASEKLNIIKLQSVLNFVRAELVIREHIKMHFHVLIDKRVGFEL